MPTSTTAQTTRGRLLAQMQRLFADDRGMGVLVDYNGRPDMSDQDKTLQRAWADTLISLHGRSRAARVYTWYARDRQQAVVDSGLTVGSWDNLVLGAMTVTCWTRDLHDFLCVGCGKGFCQVVVDRYDPMCSRCARDHTTPGEAAPLWTAYSHSRFVFPGLLSEELAGGEHVVQLRYTDGEERDYITGDVGPFASRLSSLPNFEQTGTLASGPSRDTINLTVQASTEHEGRRFDIVADFAYDPDPDGSEPHPYGFRFKTGQVTARTGEARTTHHTDVYELLEVLLTGLYAPSGDMR
ncbi:hypothetical protein ACWD0J_27090 [Streptomyces sp. NPDC003011]